MKRIVSLMISCGVLLSCNSKIADSIKIDKKSITKKIGHNLYDKTLPTPTECYGDRDTTHRYSTFRGYVNLCVDLMLNDAETISYHDTKNCIYNLGEKFSKISSLACRNTMLTDDPGNLKQIFGDLLDAYFDKNVLSNNNGEIVLNWDNGLDETDPNYEPYVQNYFSLVGYWQSETLGFVYPENSFVIMPYEQAKFYEDRISKKLWDAVQNYSQEWKDTFGQISANPIAKNTEKLFKIFDTTLLINRIVLEQIYKSDLLKNNFKWSPMDTERSLSPLFAAIIGDTLSPFFERIRTITKVYDVACKLSTCTEEFYESNKTVWLLKYLESVGRGESIDLLVIDGDDESELANFVKSIHNVSDSIASSISKINTTLAIPSVYKSPVGEDFPSYLKSFRNIFVESHDLMASYNQTKSIGADGEQRAGYFHGGNVYQVNVGFGKVNMDRHIQEVTNVNNNLTNVVSTFKSNHSQLISQVMQINSNEIRLNDLNANITQDVTEIFNLKQQIDSVRSYIANRNTEYSRFIEQIVRNLGNSAETFVKVGQTQTLEINANTSNEGSGTFVDVGKIAFPAPSNIERGDLFQVRTIGEYQPNCAIGSTYGSAVSTAKTSTRGYNLTFSKGKSRVQSVDKYKMQESYTDVSVSAKACAGYGWGGPTGGRASVDVCASATAGTRSASGTRTSDTTSNSTRSDSSFDLGLTLANTPFVNSPVGALLLVEMPIDLDTGLEEVNKLKYSSIKTLSNSNSFIAKNAEADSNYYFVVNDCQSANNNGSVIVEIDQYRAAGATINQYLTKVNAILPLLESQVAGLIENGILGEGTLATLRTQLASADVGGTSLSSFSGNIKLLLESFIDTQIDILRYKSQLSVMERKLALQKQRLESLLEHYTDEEEDKFLKVSQRNWLLANMDFDFVNLEGTNGNLYTLSRIINILEHSLVSYLDFKYKEKAKREIVGNTALLTDLDFTAPFDDIAKNINVFMTELLDRIKDDLNNRPFVPKVSTGVHIPNPYYVKPNGFPDPVYSYPVMDTFRAKKFWDNLYAWKTSEEYENLYMDVVFDDLYADNGLGCYVESPIIDSMGLYFLPENEGYITDFNRRYKNVNAKYYLEGLSYIPFEHGVSEYNFINRDWRFMDVALRMAVNANDAKDRLANEFPTTGNIESGLGTGRSPFGTFRIGDLRAYRYDTDTMTPYIGDTPLDRVKELFVAYNLEASNDDIFVNLGWLNNCQ